MKYLAFINFVVVIVFVGFVVVFVVFAGGAAAAIHKFMKKIDDEYFNLKRMKLSLSEVSIYTP